jgi:cation-transporting P-type ATPase C
VLRAICAAEFISTDLVPARARSADIANADVLRMVIGGIALTLLGMRRYLFARPPVLGPTSRLLATGATVVTGYPFIRGALRSLRGGRSAGTDALVTVAAVASLVLRENVVALTVLWLLNIVASLKGAAVGDSWHFNDRRTEAGSLAHRARQRNRNDQSSRQDRQY